MIQWHLMKKRKRKRKRKRKSIKNVPKKHNDDWDENAHSKALLVYFGGLLGCYIHFG